jgi:hypothetical protein
MTSRKLRSRIVELHPESDREWPTDHNQGLGSSVEQGEVIVTEQLKSTVGSDPELLRTVSFEGKPEFKKKELTSI